MNEAHGGTRPGAGRPKGSTNKKPRASSKLSVPVPAKLRELAQARADLDGVTLSSVVQSALSSYLREQFKVG